MTYWALPQKITKPKFDRLSELEKQVILLLAQGSQPIDSTIVCIMVLHPNY
jgi:hypothetical protein